MDRLKSGLILFWLAAGLAFSLGPREEGLSAPEPCLDCHSHVTLLGTVHGSAGISCVDCHADLAGFSDFPHAEDLRPVACTCCHDAAAAAIAESVHGRPHAGPMPFAVQCKDCHGTHEILSHEDEASRTFALNIPDTCLSCHLERVKAERGPAFVGQYLKSVHFRALSEFGLSVAANCVTCHGGHDVRPVDAPDSKVSRAKIIGTCGECHVGTKRDYLEGVHGKAYVKGVGDVPVCTDCHAEHDIRSHEDLDSAVYATQVASVCARCHDDERLARQYGLLTSRLKTYASSYHGMASKAGETSVANCASCHGHHNIRPSNDPKSSINAANISATCGGCHPGAGANVAKGRIHVVSERTENRLGYIVKVVYLIVIAGLLSVFLAFIAADLYRRLRDRWTK